MEFSGLDKALHRHRPFTISKPCHVCFSFLKFVPSINFSPGWLTQPSSTEQKIHKAKSMREQNSALSNLWVERGTTINRQSPCKSQKVVFLSQMVSKELRFCQTKEAKTTKQCLKTIVDYSKKKATLVSFSNKAYQKHFIGRKQPSPLICITERRLCVEIHILSQNLHSSPTLSIRCL